MVLLGSKKRRVRIDAHVLRQLRKRDCYLRYQYCMILNTAKEFNVHLKIVEFLYKAGLCVALLDNDVTEDHVLVLVSMEPLHDMLDDRHLKVNLPAAAGAKEGEDGGNLVPEPLTARDELDAIGLRMLHRENQLRFMEQFLKLGSAAAGGTVPPPTDTNLTKARRLELAHRAISRVLDAVTFELGNSPDFEGETAWDYVDMLFPLHDARWNKRFLKRFTRSLSDGRNWVPESVRKWLARRDGDIPEDEVESGDSDSSDDEDAARRRARAAAKRAGASGGAAHATPAKSVGSRGAAVAASGPSPSPPTLGAGRETVRSAGSDFSDTDSESDDDAPTGQAASDGWLGGYSTEWAVQEIRDHMGERAGFYFAFLAHYTGWLTSMAFVLAAWFVSMRWTSWFGYQRGLMWLGWGVAALWAPVMLRMWQQRSSIWEERWGVNNMPLEDHDNPKAAFLFAQADPTTGELRRRYDPTNNRLKIALGTLPAYLLNIAAMLITVAPFLQWYVFVRMAPTCECCEWHKGVGTQNRNASVVPPLPPQCDFLNPQITTALTAPVACKPVINCFVEENSDLLTSRGLYLFVIGASLGIMLQIFQFELSARVARRVTAAEHWPTEEQHDKTLFHRLFSVMYVNVMFFFILLTFLYGPLGTWVQVWLNGNGLDALVPIYGWVEGSLSIDEVVAVPIVFIQLANLVRETIVPMYDARRIPRLPRVDVAPSAKGAEARQLALLRRGDVDPTAYARRAIAATNGAAGPGAVAGNGVILAPSSGVGGVGRGSEAGSGYSPAVRMGDGGRSAVESPAPRVTVDVGDHSKDLPGAIATPPPQTESKRAPHVGSVGQQGSGGRLVSLGMSPGITGDGSGGGVSGGGVVGFPPDSGGLADDWDEEDDEEDDDEDTVELKPKDKHEPTHKLARRLWERTRTPIAVLDYVDDPCHYDAAAVMEQANLPEFETSDEYLDMAKQFVLVCSLTVAWAWAPLAAAINNNVEMRADAFKMVRAMRRPIPRRDEGIGEWERIFAKAIYASLPIACGIIALASGLIEYWQFQTAGCHADLRGARMVVDHECVGDWAWRLLWLVVFERAGVIAVGTIFRRIPDEPQWLQDKHARHEARDRRQNQDKMMAALPGGLRANLEFLFHSFDADGNGNLSRQELADMLDVMLPGPLPSAHMRMLLSLVDVDQNSTTTFAEFAHALRQCEQDAVLSAAIDVKQLAAAAAKLAEGVRGGHVATEGVFGTDGDGRLTEAEQRRNFEAVRRYLHGEG
uniref:EF-hand domain-containing protein n=1 Tax=Bicosoecida sp. CB-2014 TaxID=1486930 RepID=A0A7S1CF20_9STRA|mmetsp:Transcript_2453/g.8316  ORF Transcript_2453/g.8316 Transcript_2453/m.8316 type:complete len:1255 (+) Transcript_2453:341-4105(+)